MLYVKHVLYHLPTVYLAPLIQIDSWMPGLAFVFKDILMMAVSFVKLALTNVPTVLLDQLAYLAHLLPTEVST